MSISPSITPIVARGIRRTAAGIAAAAGLSVSGPLPAQTELLEIDAKLFPVPETLAANVEFWTQVYTAYDSHHVLVHDELYPGVIYEVIDLTAIDGADESEIRRHRARREKVRDTEAKYRAILTDLASGRKSEKYAEDQDRVARLFESVPGEGRSRYSGSIGRMRTQTCLSDRFAEGVERSGRFMAAIEEIFARRGLPLELTRLPFVESLFQIQAQSSASAAGIWQFVRSTARLYLKMELEYDDRYDPLRASDAAARHLQDNYAVLKSWPLAVTAYNHGTNGMARAVRLLGTNDLGEIATRYRSRTFGFASRNFYSEFVAAARIYANRERYFPGVEPLPPIEFDVFVAEEFVPVAELARRASISLEEIRDMNPALGREVWSDDLFLPAAYELRVPRGRSGDLRTAYGALEDERKSAHQVGLYYRVRSGDTLGAIARRFGTSIASLQRVNALASANRIHVGQTLLIPPARGSASGRARTSTTATAIAGAVPSSHVVSKGETLWQIAQRHGVSLDGLRAANGLADDRIYVGQRLAIPAAGERVHVVQKGENLAKIAALYGISVEALKNANGLRGDLIRPSQVLLIP